MTYASLFAAVVALALVIPANGQDAGKGKGWNGTFQKPPEAELKKKLTPLQFEVTQQAGTERAFSGAVSPFSPRIKRTDEAKYIVSMK